MTGAYHKEEEENHETIIELCRNFFKLLRDTEKIDEINNPRLFFRFGAQMCIRDRLLIVNQFFWFLLG